MTKNRKRQILAAWREFLRDTLGAIEEEDLLDFLEHGSKADVVKRNARLAACIQAMDESPFDDEEFIRRAAYLTDEQFLQEVHYLYTYGAVGMSIETRVLIMAELLEHIVDAPLVLDVGCGPCGYLVKLKNLGVITGRIVGVDPSEAWAEQIAQSEGVEVELHQCLAQDLPFADSSVPEIICIDALPWSLQWRKWVVQFGRVMTEGAKLFIAYSPKNPRTHISPLELTSELSKAGIDVQAVYNTESSAHGSLRTYIVGIKQVPKKLLIVPGLNDLRL